MAQQINIVKKKRKNNNAANKQKQKSTSFVLRSDADALEAGRAKAS